MEGEQPLKQVDKIVALASDSDSLRSRQASSLRKEPRISEGNRERPSSMLP